MADFPALPLFTDAYLGDTMHLSLEEHGAYLKLLIIMWRSPDCALDDDDKRLATMLGVTVKKWSTLKPTLMNFFSPAEGKKLTQKRLRRERRYVEQKSAQARRAAEAKHMKYNETDFADAGAGRGAEPPADAVPEPMPDRCETDAPTPTPTITESSLRSDSAAEDAPTPANAVEPETIPPVGTPEHESWCYAVARSIGQAWVVTKLRGLETPWSEIEGILTSSRSAGSPKDFLLRCYHERQRTYRNGSTDPPVGDLIERALGPSGGSA